MLKTKIVCTIGPSTSSFETLKALAEAGMNVLRLNFSHGTHESHGKVIELTRELSSELKKPLALLQDLPGPRLRIGSFASSFIHLQDGAEFTLTANQVTGNTQHASINYPNLINEVKTGDKIYLADGTIKLEVVEVGEAGIRCKVLVGGILHSGKGINIPEKKLRLPTITEKDIKGMEFGARHHVDFVALSFVQTARDVNKARELLNRMGSKAGIIAKIERKSAVKDLPRILNVSDGVMVARGDLGVESGFENIPILQKQIIRECNLAGKPVITATQILTSMVTNPNPTRAEVTDIANAIFDGTDALMLSEETAVGQHPVEAVKVMVKVANNAEKNLPYAQILEVRREVLKRTTAGVISYSACQIAADIGAAAIVVPTRSGSSAYRVSMCRPPHPIIALVGNEVLQRRLLLSWGVKPCLFDAQLEEGELPPKVKEALTQHIAPRGAQHLVIVYGGSKTRIGSTNIIKVQMIGRKS